MEVTWSTIALPDAGSSAWAHPGAATSNDGSIYLGAADGCHIHRLDMAGKITTVAVPTTECHGLAVTGDDSVWIADPGRKATLHDGALSIATAPGRVLRVDADGRLERELVAPRPGWMPTGVALNSHDDRVWVADGYGLHEVHAFDGDGKLLWTSHASASGTVFSTPHGIVVDRRGVEPRLLVADRGNRRIVALTLDGDYLSEFGSDVLTSPSGLAIAGDLLWVSELFGAVVAFGPDGQFVRVVGDATEKHEPGWPNSRSGERVIPAAVVPENFRSPHGIAALSEGEVIVTEWIIGGRASILSISQ